MRTVRMVSEQLIALIAMVRTAHPTYIVYISRYKPKNSVNEAGRTHRTRDSNNTYKNT
jgi:hypothetical protein